MRAHNVTSRDPFTRNGSPPPPAIERTAREQRVRAARTLFFVAAGISFVLSVALWFLGDREQGLFVGLWVPSILSLGALLLNGQGGLR